MVELFDKNTCDAIMVYAIKTNSSKYPMFLIREKNQWIWRSAKHFITYEERTIKYSD